MKKENEKIIDIIRRLDLPDDVKSEIIVQKIMGMSDDTIIQNAIVNLSEIKHDEIKDKFPMPQIPQNYDRTERMIAEMLLSDTGINIMDSGGENNRHWQKNRILLLSGHDFKSQPYVYYEADRYNHEINLNISISTFHYLSDMLTFDDESEMLTKLMYKVKKADSYGLSIIDDFIDYLTDNHELSNVFTFNTFNYENALDQVLQGATFRLNDSDHVFTALQIHNGADVRGGYTDPIIFRGAIQPATNIVAYCDCRTFYTDDTGYHWYSSDGDTDQIFSKWTVDNEKLVCLECGKEIQMYADIMEDYEEILFE